MKSSVFFAILFVLTLLLVGCNAVAPIQETPMQSKYYKWTQQTFHPRISVVNRTADSITYNLFFDTEDWANSLGNVLEINAQSRTTQGTEAWTKKYLIPAEINNSGVGQFQCDLTLPCDTNCQSLIFFIKESKSIREGTFTIPFKPLSTGWQWSGDLGTGCCPSGIALRKPKEGKIIFAPRSERLPSPPFSANAPFVPTEKSELGNTNTLITTQAGMYAYTSKWGVERLQVIDSEKNPHFPAITQMEEMIGPIRYLCSKEEFERIQNSHDGPENAFDKFWIRSGGNKSKAKELIKIYYSRVQDANQNFTSYAEGWRTDRGMIYLVFGHPNTIITNQNVETWIYGNLSDPQALKFDFEITAHPLWGDIYILKRSENYRGPWETQVTQWRQGRIYP